MPNIPKKVAERLSAGLKRFQPILAASKARDDGEGDTVMIVTDMLAEVFGYDKYADVTAEYAIRGTYCDLATRLVFQGFVFTWICPFLLGPCMGLVMLAFRNNPDKVTAWT